MSKEQQSLVSSLAKELVSRQLSLVTAESCTGGLIAARCTDVAGSSSWFDRGFVTYSNASKQQMLGVSEAVLLEYGAVSEQTVIAMAKGAVNNSQANLSVSVSGIAGPSGGTDSKPVGTVWFAWSLFGETRTACQVFSGDRMQIRDQAVTFALMGIHQFLERDCN